MVSTELSVSSLNGISLIISMPAITLSAERAVTASRIIMHAFSAFIISSVVFCTCMADAHTASTSNNIFLMSVIF